MRQDVKATVARLRQRLERLESGGAGPSTPPLALGVQGLDGRLGGGLKRGALHEASGTAGFAFAAGLASIADDTTLWIDAGGHAPHLYPCGLNGMGLPPDRLLCVAAEGQDALWAFEQALRSGAAPLVVAAAPAPDFAESRRLGLAAREGGGLGLLLPTSRPAGHGTQSAAETRWRATALAAPRPWERPRFRLELLKNKKGSFGAWEIEWDGETYRFHMAAGLRDGFGGAPPARLAG